MEAKAILGIGFISLGVVLFALFADTKRIDITICAGCIFIGGCILFAMRG